jgi:hypothetical protein
VQHLLSNKDHFIFEHVAARALISCDRTVVKNSSTCPLRQESIDAVEHPGKKGPVGAFDQQVLEAVATFYLSPMIQQYLAQAPSTQRSVERFRAASELRRLLWLQLVVKRSPSQQAKFEVENRTKHARKRANALHRTAHSVDPQGVCSGCGYASKNALAWRMDPASKRIALTMLGRLEKHHSYVPCRPGPDHAASSALLRSETTEQAECATERDEVSAARCELHEHQIATWGVADKKGRWRVLVCLACKKRLAPYLCPGARKDSLEPRGLSRSALSVSAFAPSPPKKDAVAWRGDAGLERKVVEDKALASLLRACNAAWASRGRVGRLVPSKGVTLLVSAPAHQAQEAPVAPARMTTPLLSPTPAPPPTHTIKCPPPPSGASMCTRQHRSRRDMSYMLNAREVERADTALRNTSSMSNTTTSTSARSASCAPSACSPAPRGVEGEGAPAAQDLVAIGLAPFGIQDALALLDKVSK